MYRQSMMFRLHDSGDEALGLLDINKASAAELMTLPWAIGEAKAAQIIAYREASRIFCISGCPKAGAGN